MDYRSPIGSDGHEHHKKAVFSVCGIAENASNVALPGAVIERQEVFCRSAARLNDIVENVKEARFSASLTAGDSPLNSSQPLDGHVIYSYLF